MLSIDNDVLDFLWKKSYDHKGDHFVDFHYAYVLADISVSEYQLKKSLKRLEAEEYIKRLRFAKDTFPHQFQLLKRA